MTTADLITRYNYDAFVPHKFGPWLRFEESPPLGEKGPDFPLTRLDNSQTTLSEILAEYTFTIVEFGSFT